jgi:hypothetical protein
MQVRKLHRTIKRVDKPVSERRKILLLAHNSEVLLLGESILQEAGYEVTTAELATDIPHYRWLGHFAAVIMATDFKEPSQTLAAVRAILEPRDP